MSRKSNHHKSSATTHLAPGMPRRSFLRRMGLAGAGAYFLPSLLPKQASAQGTPPRRFLLFYTGHASPYYSWSMRQPGLSESAAWEFALGGLSRSDFSEIYAPLHPFRDKLLLLDTLSNPVGLEMKGAGGGHFGGPASLLTGSSITKDKNNRAQGPSIDQFIASQTLVSGGVRSLELGFGNPYPIVWGSGGNSLPLSSAADVFDRLFAGRGLGGAVAPPPPPAVTPTLTRADRIAQARKGILEHTRQRYRLLASHISAEERMRLEAHADLIGDLALTLAGPDDSDGGSDILRPVASAGCYEPNRGTPGDFAGRVDAMGQTVAAAFACDLTRVASIQLPQMGVRDFGGPAGADVHQDIAHHGDQGGGSYQNMVKYYVKHAEHFASVLGSLDAVQEPDGSRLLDNTIVMWVPECGSWVHQMSHVPVVLAGGGGFRMGRYLHWDNIDPVGFDGGNGGTRYSNLGPSISRLLVSISQQMGIDTNQVGNTASAFGIPMAGTLDRLV